MVLVSFKNIYIWPSYGQKWRSCRYLGIFLGYNSAIFGPIWLKVFKGVQETIIYWLVMKHLSCDAYFSFLIFWAHFCGENGRGPPKPTKKLADWVRWTFWVNSHLKIMLTKLSGVNPPLYPSGFEFVVRFTGYCDTLLPIFLLLVNYLDFRYKAEHNQTARIIKDFEN